jgi:hypothetical protein
MSRGETRRIDQALFGYSDGHRQLAASVRLSSRDTYYLAGASDLAAGVTLSGDETYLTGIPLTESESYALIRTWSAPEMPRPGCVWSHVLLLSQNVLASEIDLEPLGNLFRRPSGAADKSYSYPTEFPVISLNRVDIDLDKAKLSLIEKILGQYYRGRATAIGESFGSPIILESAIFAVWSQQWPRLRRTFRFRTAEC